MNNSTSKVPHPNLHIPRTRSVLTPDVFVPLGNAVSVSDTADNQHIIYRYRHNTHNTQRHTNTQQTINTFYTDTDTIHTIHTDIQTYSRQSSTDTEPQDSDIGT